MWIQGILMANLSEKIKVYLEQNGKEWKNHLYFDGDIIIQNASDGTGDKITQWNVSGLAKPTDEQLNALESEATKLENNNKVDAARRTSYGSWNDQLDEIYHDIDLWKARLQTIKTNNPKS